MVTIYPIYERNETLTYHTENDQYLTKIAFEILLWSFLSSYLTNFFANVESLNALIVKVSYIPYKSFNLVLKYNWFAFYFSL